MTRSNKAELLDQIAALVSEYAGIVYAPTAFRPGKTPIPASGKLLGEVVAVRSTAFDLDICPCAGESCATLKAGTAKIKTRCIDIAHDKACGNEAAIYRPLAKGVTAHAAFAVEHSFTGKDLKETWNDGGRRGAYVGSFAVR